MNSDQQENPEIKAARIISQYKAKSGNSGLAIFSLIIPLISFQFSIPYLPMLGVVVGLIALQKSEKLELHTGYSSRRKYIAALGLLLSIFMLVIQIISQMTMASL